jgi:heptosyltransferase II
VVSIGEKVGRRILIAQTSFLGDVVLTTPLARVIAEANPGADMWWLVRPDAVAVVSPAVGADRVLTLDKRGRDRDLGALRAAARRLRGLDFQIAIGVQRSLRTALLLALARVPLRIGFAGTLGAAFYHRTVRRVGPHARDRLLGLATALGIALPDPLPLPSLVVDPAAQTLAERLLAESGVAPGEPVVVVAPGSAWPTKEWPVESFAKLAAELAAHSGERIVVVGTAADRGHARTILSHLATRGLVAVVARASLVVANDSAPAHFAAALGRPTVALFGPTVPAQGFAPLGPQVRIAERALACRPCSRHGGRVCPIDTHACLAGLSPAAVLAQVQALGILSGSAVRVGMARPAPEAVGGPLGGSA